MIVGNGLGTMIGRRIRSVVPFSPLRAADRLVGGGVNVVVSALVMSMLAFSIGALGVPFVSQQLAESKVIRFIDGVTPMPVKASMAQLRSAVIGEGIPTLLDGFGQSQPVAVPDTSTDTPALNKAAASVLKIAGTAYQCGQNQTGTGFVVAPGRVVTNAHVVAGVDEPVVETPGGRALPGRVVYFDSQHDLAVVAVDGLRSEPLALAADLPSGSAAAFAGYPHGGPFQSKPATVQDIATVLVPDIYGKNASPEDVYRLAGDVQPGNSGGPLLTMDGQVAGVVFAKATTESSLGFAITMNDLSPVAAQAPGLGSAVSSGQCIKK
jgi:S1-C subfamily serine protease